MPHRQCPQQRPSWAEKIQFGRFNGGGIITLQMVECRDFRRRAEVEFHARVRARLAGSIVRVRFPIEKVCDLILGFRKRKRAGPDLRWRQWHQRGERSSVKRSCHQQDKQSASPSNLCRGIQSEPYYWDEVGMTNHFARIIWRAALFGCFPALRV